MIPLYGDPPQCTQHYRWRPGVYAILSRDGHLLLTRKAGPVPEVQLPGGGMDQGESPITSLHREVLEETGWAIAGLRRITAYRRFTYMPDYDVWAEKLCHIYVGRPVLSKGPPTEPGHQAIWAKPETAVRLLASDGDRKVVSAFSGGQWRSFN